MLKAIAVLACLWQLTAANDQFTWCNCMKNPSEAKKSYETLFADYWKLANEYLGKAYKAYDSRVKQMNANNAGNAYYNKSVRDMTYQVIELCTIPYLKDEYRPFWNGKEVSDKEVCDWLSTSGEIARRKMKFNGPMIENCDWFGLFDKVVQRNYEQAIAGVDSCEA